MSGATHLSVNDLAIGYDAREIGAGNAFDIERGSFTVIIGPNACGKSTLLKTLARVLKPRGGAVLIDGENAARIRPKTLAKKLGLLSQSAIAPEGITVADLVARGRYPHQSALRSWSDADERAVVDALVATGTLEFGSRPLDELSGGQRQRVWVAMALAQESELLLLDEPTTFLDLAQQVSLLNLFENLRKEHGRTLIAVLHDVNQACRYADRLLVMREGRIVADGDPSKIVTADLLADVFGLDAIVVDDPITGTPLVVPR